MLNKKDINYKKKYQKKKQEFIVDTQNIFNLP